MGSTAGASLKSIHVLRKPCSDSTVAANVLRHGTGALNIDACRITAKHEVNPPIARREAAQKSGRAPITGRNALESTADGRIERRGSHEVYMAAHPGEQLGRWPANLILQHFEDCRQDGFRTVKSSAQATGPTRSGVSHSVSRSSYSGAAAPAPSYGDADGRESIPAWTCDPGCPVAELDQQSGISSGVVRKPTGKPLYSTEGRSMVWNSNSVVDTTERGFADAGGASRFFKQFHGKPE